MRILTRYIVKEHLLPFVYTLLILIFLLFTNFLLRAVDKFLGKGLPLAVIMEYLALNMAWIVALATPWAVLWATLMAFGRLSEDNEITAIRASGVSLVRLLFPALSFSVVVAGLLIFFNNAVLPDMNHRARLLTRDIYRKRPDLNIEPGYIIDDLPQYSLIVKGKRGDRFQDAKIDGKDWSKTRTSIFAKEATFSTIEDAIVVTLYDGEIHELDAKNYQNYRVIAFEKHRIKVPADNLSLERRESKSRGEREMTVKMMREKVDYYRNKIAKVKERITTQLQKQIPNVTAPEDFQQASALLQQLIENVKASPEIEERALNQRKRAIKTLTQRVKSDYGLLGAYAKSANRFLVEIHKKFSLPVACVVFVLIGAPLGVAVRKGGFIVAFLFAFFITVLIYYPLIIVGEQLADRNLLSPFLAMWGPNIILGVIGLVLSYSTSKQERVLRLRLWSKPRKENRES